MAAVENTSAGTIASFASHVVMEAPQVDTIAIVYRTGGETGQLKCFWVGSAVSVLGLIEILKDRVNECYRSQQSP